MSTQGAPRRELPLGGLALLSAATGVVSGVFLAFHYAPTLDAARSSIQHLETHVVLGALLRSLHHWCGNLALGFALLHGIRAAWRGGFRRAPRGRWPLACGTLVVLLLLGWTGYLLAGDARALTGIDVAQGVARGAPLFGDAAARVLLGGDAVSSATLVRLYAAHSFVLPALLAMLVTLLVRDAGTWHRAIPWAPALAAVLLACALAWPPAPGEAPDLLAGSDAHARPEWFFLWINALLGASDSNPFWVGAALPAVLLGALSTLPWWARRPRPALERTVLVLVLASLATLSVLALPDAGAFGQAAEQPTTRVTTDLAAFEREVAAAMERFRCRSCHVVDGDADGGDTGPPLDRDKFAGLYTRRFFRLKVGDPVAFWKHTGMVYTPRRLKPTEEQVELLERWFFGDGAGTPSD